ncbi:MAG: sigma-54-dependent Fis family transcriptional regulator [Deltaproteobacteria bacterium]|nr:MAG: sigma-54-dependent Fis family transcriptional regulator [Deltaproteobacteria bacterium]
MRNIFVVSKQQEAFRAISTSFGKGYRVDEAPTKDAAIEMLRKKRADFVFIDLVMLRESSPGDGYKAALEPFWNLYPTIEIIVMSPQEMIREAVMAVKAGASDYITYPINPEEVKHVTETVHESLLVESELGHLRDQFWQPASFEFIRTKSAVMNKVLDRIRSVAPTRSTVLLVGDTGTGKGELAKLIHRHSSRRDAQFISVHCGAIPDTLLESELFGHEKGAFTGAVNRKLGKFEIARGGTIFLDEIGTLTPSAQIKLLQILQDRTFQRVGGEATIEADVRVVAATNTDLKKMCEQGQFRRDLYYRLNVFPIEVPPLTERIEDIPHLVEVFLKRMNRFGSKEINDVHPQVLEAFRNYPWPGNIRELENLMERAYILELTSMLTPESFPSELFESKVPHVSISVDTPLILAEVRHKAMEEIEKSYLNRLLTRKRGRIKDSAQEAGITTRQLHKLMKKYDIRKEHYKL